MRPSTASGNYNSPPEDKLKRVPVKDKGTPKGTKKTFNESSDQGTKFVPGKINTGRAGFNNTSALGGAKGWNKVTSRLN